jgi:hypothetical protein
MGYDSHITRKSTWADDDGPKIRLDEWIALVAASPGVSPISEARVGERLVKLPPDWHSHQWQAHPQFRPSGPIFHLRSGNIDFRADDAASMHFALRLARELNARVVGDEDEEYDLDSIVGGAGDLSSDPVNPFTRDPLYQRRHGTLELRNGEHHLLTHQPTVLRQERALLHFIVPPPASLERLDRGTLHVRGSLSEPGNYGLDGSCGNVFYVLHVVAFAPTP